VEGVEICPQSSARQNYKKPRVPLLRIFVPYSFFDLSNLMTAHVYLPMEMATLTVIPYTLKLQKPFNRNVHNPVSKPLVNQPNPLNAF
jgi:hypothetical protein